MKLILVSLLALPFNLTLVQLVALLTGIYEVVIRVIPTVANYSIIGKIIDGLKWLSEFLNRKKAQ